jgi:uncharacterized repeat protein (TIGR03803 family)
MPTKQWKANVTRGLAITAAALALCALAQGAPKYAILHSFTGGADGDGSAGVILDPTGNVYGASLGGGSQNCGSAGCGVIFELTPGAGSGWAFTVLYDFTGGSDAGSPNSPLFLDASGDLYGTTAGGGARGGGTVFELAPGAGGWTQTVLYSFCNQQGCVGLPQAGVVMGQSGNLYGTTPESPNGGAVYRVAKVSGRWKETPLHKFCPKWPSCDHGALPYAGLILDGSGNLYGTTSYGGKSCGDQGCGITYELSPVPGGKWKETILHHFDDIGNDGFWPGSGQLYMDHASNLYGTTVGGGSAGGWGTVFKLMPSSGGRWKESVLYSFSNGASGGYPSGGVVMDNGGNLYGLTADGGIGCGVLYKLAPSAKGKWTYSVLHAFGQGADGCIPVGNLALDKKGNLYGGAVLGGKYGYGVVFELTP